MRYLKSLNIEDLIFIDIEVCPIEEKLVEGSVLYDNWIYKLRNHRELLSTGKSYEELYTENASLYPEFSKIVCISIGKIKDDVLKLKSYYGDNEYELLKDFNKVMTAIVSSNKNTRLVGHFINGYDIPFIFNRSIINGIEPCSLVDVAHLKPWEVTSVDTHSLWKGTSLRSSNLMNICFSLGLGNPKQEMSGYDVGNIYYSEGGLEKIVAYCEADVYAVANLVRKMRFESIIDVEYSPIDVKNVGTLEKLYNRDSKISEEEENILKNASKGFTKKEQDIAKELINIIKNK